MFDAIYNNKKLCWISTINVYIRLITVSSNMYYRSVSACYGYSMYIYSCIIMYLVLQGYTNI